MLSLGLQLTLDPPVAFLYSLLELNTTSPSLFLVTLPLALSETALVAPIFLELLEPCAVQLFLVVAPILGLLTSFLDPSLVLYSLLEWNMTLPSLLLVTSLPLALSTYGGADYLEFLSLLGFFPTVGFTSLWPNVDLVQRLPSNRSWRLVFSSKVVRSLSRSENVWRCGFFGKIADFDLVSDLDWHSPVDLGSSLGSWCSRDCAMHARCQVCPNKQVWEQV